MTRDLVIRPVDLILEEMQQFVEENPGHQAVQLEGLDNAIVGIGEREEGKPVFIYNVSLLLWELQQINQWSRIEAQEWFDHNVNAHYGEGSPILMT